MDLEITAITRWARRAAFLDLGVVDDVAGPKLQSSCTTHAFELYMSYCGGLAYTQFFR